MDLSQVLAGLESAKKQYAALVTAAAKPLEEQLSVAVKDLGVKGIRWTQYTPHFNDGDECVFNVNSPFLLTEDDEDGEEDLEIWAKWDEKPGSYFTQYMRPSLDKLGITEEKWKAISNFGRLISDGSLEDVLREAFGEGVQVTVTADRVEVEQYEHD